MDISALKTDLLKINQQVGKEINDKLTSFYANELPAFKTSGNYSDLGAALKGKEKRFLSSLAWELPNKCEDLVIDALIKNGLPKSKTQITWDSISRKIDTPQYTIMNDAEIRDESLLENRDKASNNSISIAIPTIFGVVCLIAFIKSKLLPIKAIMALGIGVCVVTGVCISGNTNIKSVEMKKSIVNTDDFLNRQLDANKNELNKYVKSVTAAALATAMEEI